MLTYSLIGACTTLYVVSGVHSDKLTALQDREQFFITTRSIRTRKLHV